MTLLEDIRSLNTAGCGISFDTWHQWVRSWPQAATSLHTLTPWHWCHGLHHTFINFFIVLISLLSHSRLGSPPAKDLQLCLCMLSGRCSDVLRSRCRLFVPKLNLLRLRSISVFHLLLHSAQIRPSLWSCSVKQKIKNTHRPQSRLLSADVNLHLPPQHVDSPDTRIWTVGCCHQVSLHS